MDLGTFAYGIAVYLVIGIAIYGYEDIMRDTNVYDYVLVFLIFWPIILVVTLVFQLIRFIKAIFKGEY
jgi:hypothetical protein